MKKEKQQWWTAEAFGTAGEAHNFPLLQRSQSALARETSVPAS